MDIALRPARATDLDTVMTLETTGFPPGIVEAPEVFARRIAAFPDGFLLAGAPEPWGYFCSEIWTDWTGESGDGDRFHLGHDIGAWHRTEGSTLYIASMTVRPEYRGGGRGRALFRSALALLVSSFPNLRQAVLIVNEHWTGARQIYRTEGFAETDRLEGFFRPSGGPVGAAVVMVRHNLRSG